MPLPPPPPLWETSNLVLMPLLPLPLLHLRLQAAGNCDEPVLSWPAMVPRSGKKTSNPTFAQDYHTQKNVYWVVNRRALHTLWVLSTSKLRPGTLTPSLVLPIEQASDWTDMKKQLVKLGLPEAERAAIEANLAERFATPQRRRRLAERKPLRPIYTYHCRAIKHSSGGSSADKREKKQRRARRPKAAEKNVTRRCQ